MPLYTFRNNETGEEWTDILTIAEKERFLQENSYITQVLSNLAIADPTRLGLRKPDNAFRDVLKHVKKHHPLGKGINTF